MLSEMSLILSEYIFYYLLLSPIFRFFFVLIFSTQDPISKSEKKVRYLVNAGIILDLLTMFTAIFLFSHLVPIKIYNFLYLHIEFTIHWTKQTISFLSFSIIILSLVTRFSTFYLHRDNYFFKFFSVIYVLELSIFLLITTIGIESIFIGWELLGLSSVLLIAFYEHRSQALKNSLLILVIYKCSDILFYFSLIYSSWHNTHYYIDISNHEIIFLILLACLIKSSIFPWIWLPRAMEGPTPSSAVFYGGIATHIPIYIFLNLWMHVHHHNIALAYIAIPCILFAIICASAMSRQCPDAKNAIAYSSISQLGIIYIEILVGLYTIAIIHTIAHGIYRSIEFLKSPSLLYHRHSIERSRKSIADETGVHFERFLPKKMRKTIYRLALNEFVLPRSIVHVIELFLGLNTSRINIQSLKHYIYPSVIIFLSIEVITSYIMHKSISLFDESLFLVSLSLNFIALVNKYRPAIFFAALSTSMATVICILYGKITNNTIYTDYILMVIFGALIIYSIKNPFPQSYEQNYNGVRSKSSLNNLIILFIGFGIIGIPGIGSFILWERLEHQLISISPNLLVNCFFIITLNTLIFFRFYYANYLGKHEVDLQYSTVERH